MTSSWRNQSPKLTLGVRIIGLDEGTEECPVPRGTARGRRCLRDRREGDPRVQVVLPRKPRERHELQADMGHVGPLPFAHLQVAEGVPVDIRRRHHEGTRGERVEDGSPVLVHKASDVAAVVAPAVGGRRGGGGESGELENALCQSCNIRV